MGAINVASFPEKTWPGQQKSRQPVRAGTTEPVRLPGCRAEKDGKNKLNLTAMPCRW
jgi:hypothetical protein